MPRLEVITLRGDDAVVVVAASQYQRLSRRLQGTLVQFLHSSPLSGVKLDLRRSRDTGRAVPL
jgi:PHD/YefM family antitoxin component YafN of YafNO toxin-antitoxin module